MARILPIFIPHEGCPHECVFCNQRRIAAPVSPDPEEVRERVNAALREGLVEEVAFYGGSFTAIPVSRQEAFLSVVRELNLDIRISTRPDCIDSDVIRRLLDYGVKTVELGAQSMDNAVLQAANRGHRFEDTVRAAALVRAAGLRLVLQVMAGLPGDAPTLRDTAEKVAALEPDGVRIYPVVVLRDTDICTLWEKGEYTPLSVSQGADAAADMLEVFLRHGIPVIRIGLNPTEDLSEGGAVAGAYHPALGEMAKSRIYLREIVRSLEGQAYIGRRLAVFVPVGRTSQAAGVSRENIRRLEAMGIKQIRIAEKETLAAYSVSILLE